MDLLLVKDEPLTIDFSGDALLGSALPGSARRIVKTYPGSCKSGTRKGRTFLHNNKLALHADEDALNNSFIDIDDIKKTYSSLVKDEMITDLTCTHAELSLAVESKIESVTIDAAYL